ncbi:MAG: hypothetical protein IPK67_01010 [Planctomycetes bacterium]|nr:hypothetical protein [Planctomycetota bacterium]
MERAPRAWVLNLDAEHELGARGAYAPTRHLADLSAREGRRLLGELVLPGDVVVTEELLAQGGAEASRARELPGYAWSPTPRALTLLRRAGARPVQGPELSVLRAVNARDFAARVREPHAGGSFEKHVALDLDTALSLLARPARGGWLARRTFGAAGRGRRRLAAGRPSESELAWLAASLRIGPLVIEPWVTVTVEYTRSAWVGPRGEVSISPPCFQATTAHGAWTRTELAERGGVGREDDRRLEEMVEAAGRALFTAGYFGPFGIDAYRHRRPDGAGEGVASVLNPMSEINARFTMDWATAMAGRVPPSLPEVPPTAVAASAPQDEALGR